MYWQKNGFGDNADQLSFVILNTCKTRPSAPLDRRSRAASDDLQVSISLLLFGTVLKIGSASSEQYVFVHP